jgi:hypothetical protein
MSHFTVLVVTDEFPEEEVLGKALQPFHEFECTGTDDQYVVDRDITEEFLAEHEKHKDDYATVQEFAEQWYSYKVVPAGTPPTLSHTHKYGYVQQLADGTIKVIDRTNPNKKWDWWVVGGRGSGVFLDQQGNRVDSIRKDAIDIEGMQAAAEQKTREQHSSILEKCPGITFDWKPWKTVYEECESNADKASELYNAQPQIKQLKKAGIWDADDFLPSLEHRVGEARRDVCSTFAVLMNGEWMQRGRMGWWACVSDENENWPEAWRKIWDTIRGDQYVTIVDCHI